MRRYRLRWGVVLGVVGLVLVSAWVLFGGGSVDRINVVLSLLSIAGVSFPSLRNQTQKKTEEAAGASADDDLDAACAYLADQALKAWQAQAEAWGLMRTVPAAVGWAWAAEDISVPYLETFRENKAQVPRARNARNAGNAGNTAPQREGVVHDLCTGIYRHLQVKSKATITDTYVSRLVVIGRAGSGKTSAMVLMMLELLKGRSKNEPVPVWITLSGWDPTQMNTLDWAEKALLRDYPGLNSARYGTGMARRLLDEGRLALFLDGLDEMPSELRPEAISKIDHDTNDIRVVLSSRREEYEKAIDERRILHAAVVELAPVSLDELGRFLLEGQFGKRRAAWEEVVAYLKDHPGHHLARTLSSPLMLTLARDTYENDDPARLIDQKLFPDSEAVKQGLLGRWLGLAYPEEGERLEAADRLAWISRNLNGERDLVWWKVLDWASRWAVPLMAGLILLIPFGLLVAFYATTGSDSTQHWMVLIPVSVAVAAFCGALIGIVSSVRRSEPRTLSIRRLSLRELRHILRHGLAAGFLRSLVIEPLVFLRHPVRALQGPQRGWPTREEWRQALVGALLLTLVLGRACSIVGWIAFWIGIALIVALEVVEVWSQPVAAERAPSPSDVHRQDLVDSVISGLLIGAVVSFVSGIVLGWYLALAVGSFIGLSAAIVGGGSAVEIALVGMGFGFGGRSIPIVAFLERAQQKQVLRQAGAIYQFRHAELQDYLTDDHAVVSPAARARQSH